ncbi:MAG: hypothetical protein KKG09_03320 [Verrucomicrobia bacterium]|nr:hypothetical protein [Verrucomicrobiota bacterium]MCG2679798.1 hypothetical protein [Kiritimatiellia bacterium]MBU4247118.1 hypothetical protein [Verrucomicrobiota bacterium]MBU4290004.1 hypothetical protein [Verrucomicrobiota bacterium]MBU4428666.1 hypothetical protein [Verrucomicrobiota bacterium]
MNAEYSRPADINKFFAQCNLNLHIGFYNDHKHLVSNQISKIDQELQKPGLDAKRKKDIEFTKLFYLTSYRQHMIVNCFLTMYSHFEECLGVTCHLCSKTMPQNKRSGLIRFKEHFEREHSVNVSQGLQWTFLRDCEKARDVLLHAAGNITLARNRQKVEDLPKRNPTLFGIDNSRIFPKEDLLVRFSHAIPEFIDWLTDQIENGNTTTGSNVP